MVASVCRSSESSRRSSIPGLSRGSNAPDRCRELRPARALAAANYDRAAQPCLEGRSVRLVLGGRYAFLRAAAAHWTAALELVSVAWAKVGSTSELEWERNHVVSPLSYLSACRRREIPAGLF